MISNHDRAISYQSLFPVKADIVPEPDGEVAIEWDHDGYLSISVNDGDRFAYSYLNDIMSEYGWVKANPIELIKLYNKFYP